MNQSVSVAGRKAIAKQIIDKITSIPDTASERLPNEEVERLNDVLSQCGVILTGLKTELPQLF
jgi:ribosomal protein S13